MIIPESTPEKTMTALLIIATIVDLGLGVLLVAVSGFVFGGGPEGMHGDVYAAAGWAAMLLACITAPIIGFVLRAKGKAGLGLIVALFPPLGALLLASGFISGRAF
jgi:hypothetical protein